MCFYSGLIFSQKTRLKKKANKFDLIIDDVDHKDILYRFKPFAKKFNSHIFITTFDQINESLYRWNNYKGLNKNFSNFKSYQIIKLILTATKFSITSRTNLLILIFMLYRKIVKYEDIFSEIQSKYLIQERHFMSSSLRNFIFKKNNGEKTILFQRNIAQLNGPEMFSCADLFFSMGKKSHLQYLECGCDFKKIFPVGSFFLNSLKLQKENLAQVPKFDLLHIASNMNHFQNTHKSFLDDWYEQFSWLVKFNQKFPEYKICIKGRENDGLRQNKKFNSIIKNSEIIFIDKFKEEKTNSFKYNSNHSYNFAFNAKVNCTWQSTVGFELIGHGKPCIYLDPGGRNTAHLPNDKYYNALKVKSYDEFEKEFFNVKKNISKTNILEKDDYCLNSDTTHDRILKILKNN